LIGYLKRIVPDTLWFACIGAIAAILSDLRLVPAFVRDPASFVSFSVFMLAIGFVIAALQDAWN
jgi:hypothetical protein